jgi:GPH family glycoside/pentoside/hexuronide:cation symporter
MSAAEQTVTAPEDRVSFPHRMAYGAGAFANNLLGAASGGMLIVLNLGLGMDPALAGVIVGAAPRLLDAFTDPLMGYISDNTRTRWGRRRPFIFIGAIITAFIFAAMWQVPADQSDNFYFLWFLIGFICFYIGYTVFITPWVALGYELTPDYNERTRLMGTQNFIGSLAFIISPWFLKIMYLEKFFPDLRAGAGGLAILIALVVIGLGTMPAIFLRERMKDVAAAESQAADDQGGISHKMADFFKGFLVTIRNTAFLKLCLATFLVFNGFQLIAAFQSYVIIYYVTPDDHAAGAGWVGWAGTVGAIVGLGVVAFVAWLGTRIGKRHALMMAIAVSAVGYALKWFCYNPETPWLVLLPAPFMAFGLSGLFTMVPSMIADVVDVDELKTHERREGMFGSIFWWMVKLGLTAAFAGSGFLLNATGFDVDLVGHQPDRTITMIRLFDSGVPVLTSLIALWAIASFPITEAKAREVREQLELRRGKV